MLRKPVELLIYFMVQSKQIHNLHVEPAELYCRLYVCDQFIQGLEAAIKSGNDKVCGNKASSLEKYYKYRTLGLLSEPFPVLLHYVLLLCLCGTRFCISGFSLGLLWVFHCVFYAFILLSICTKFKRRQSCEDSININFGISNKHPHP